MKGEKRNGKWSDGGDGEDGERNKRRKEREDDGNGDEGQRMGEGKKRGVLMGNEER